MAARSVLMNHLEARISVHALDMRQAALTLGYCKHTLVVCNPPYSPPGTSLPSQNTSHRIARHASDLTLAEVTQSGSALLKNNGRMALVYPAARALMLMDALRAARLEPKRIRLVHDRPGAAPKLVLIDAVKNAKPMLHWQEPLILRNEDGQWSQQWHEIYCT